MPYDPAWPYRYAELADQLHQTLGRRWQLEHIGSTSVPGLLAKPVIDRAVRVPDPAELDDKLTVLETIGWTDLTALPLHQTLYQLDHDRVRRGIAHLFSTEQWATAPQRLFPAWLRTHPTDRDTYARLKQTLRDTGTWGHGYTAAKAAFVNHISGLAVAGSDNPSPGMIIPAERSPCGAPPCGSRSSRGARVVVDCRCVSGAASASGAFACGSWLGQ